MRAHFSVAEFGKNVVHLKKDGFEEADHKEEEKDTRKSGLTCEPFEQLARFHRALPDSAPDAGQETGVRRLRPLAFFVFTARSRSWAASAACPAWSNSLP